MLLTNRLFERQPPGREAKSIYIFCEGAKREPQYFEFFREMDPRINIEVYRLSSNEDNSPRGLLSIAKECILPDPDNPPKYDFQENDEVWIVLDTDPDKSSSREKQIQEVKAECHNLPRWNTVESNPCFEVWLLYHVNDQYEGFEQDNTCNAWKQRLNAIISSGFDSRRHPIYIQQAIDNAKYNFSFIAENRPNIGSTEVYHVAESIVSITKDKITKVLNKLDS